jgi:hypothetical protein
MSTSMFQIGCQFDASIAHDLALNSSRVSVCGHLPICRTYHFHGRHEMHDIAAMLGRSRPGYTGANSPRAKHKEIMLFFFKSVLSAILCPRRLIPLRKILCTSPSDVIPRRCNHLVNFTIRVKLAIFHDSSQDTTEPKITRAYVW